MFYPRWLSDPLRRACDAHPVVVLTGARQVGKSTLLRHAEPFASWRYRSLDDFDTLRQAEEDPRSLWGGSDQVVLDEVQRVPRLLSAVKLEVDERERRVRFVLSGSANLLLLKQVSESLAGRAVYLTLGPMTLGELHRVAPPDLLWRALSGEWPEEHVLAEPPADPVPLLLRGFMPSLLALPATEWVNWWSGYVATYLERDLRQLAQIENLLDFRRLMELLALRCGKLLNQAELARDADLSHPTAHRYLALLEATCLYERLPPYLANRSARLVKAPKALWADPGLAVFLAGYYDEESLRHARELGSFFEAMIWAHVRTITSLWTPPARLYHWRERSGDEVDLVVEHGRRLLGIEIKMAPRVSYEETQGLRRFLEAHPQASGGLLVYGGSEVRRLGERIVAVPWSMLTG